VESAAERQHGVVKFEVSTDAVAIYEASAKLEDCNMWSGAAAGELPVSTSRGGLNVSRILQSGITLGNVCGEVPARIVAQPGDTKPGEVVMFYRNRPRLRRNSAR